MFNERTYRQKMGKTIEVFTKELTLESNCSTKSHITSKWIKPLMFL